MSRTVGKRVSAALLIGFLSGIIWLLGARALIAKNTAPHYHANFAVFVEGQRLKFEGPSFYEEVTACNESGPNDVAARAHMHENVGHTIHVHDNAVTWGMFFANLRYGLSDTSLALDDKVLVNGQDGKQLSFMLNGKTTGHVANKVIGDQDVLLVSYGTDNDQAISAHYNSIQKDAKHYDENKDPASCAGAHDLSLGDRIKRALSVNQTN